MPQPKSRSAPRFKGKKVGEFLEDFNALADAARLTSIQKGSVFARYLSSKVRLVVDSLPEFQSKDFDGMVKRLKSLYESAEEKPKTTVQKLKDFVRTEREEFQWRKDFDEYTRLFLEHSNGLVAGGKITQKEIDRQYFIGLPPALQARIKPRLLEAGLKQTPAIKYTKENPPPFNEVFEEAAKEFDPEAIDAPSDAEDGDSDSDDGSDAYDSDSSSDGSSGGKGLRRSSPAVKEAKASDSTKAKDKRHDHSKSKTVPQTGIDELTQLVRDLKIEVAEVKNKVESPKTVSASGGRGATNDYRCYMCDSSTHTGGTFRCPETKKLLGDGLIKYAPNGRLVLYDGSDLPRVEPGHGGVAKAIREMAARVKAKTRDTPPHQVACADLLIDGRPALYGDIYALSSEEVYYYDSDAVTRSGKSTRDARNEVNQKPIQQRVRFRHVAPTPRIDEVTDDEAPNGRQPIRPPTPPATRVPVREEPPKTTERDEDVEMKDVKAKAKGKGKENPPVELTREHFRDNRPHVITSPTPQAAGDSDGSDTSKREITSKNAIPKESTTDDRNQTTDKDKIPMTKPHFHYTSDLKDKVSIKEVADHILDSRIEIPLKMILASSTDLQREIGTQTRIRRDYAAKAAEFVYHDPELDGGIRLHPYSPDQTGSENVRNLLERYSYNIAPIGTNNMKYFALGTGCIRGSINGLSARMLVDSGSELNIMPRRVFDAANLPLDPDGAHWTLRGIGNEVQKLLGCARNVPVEIGGHRYDHHFFVTSGDNRYDAILGQPWLLSVAANISYDKRDSSMQLIAHVNGDVHGPRVIVNLTRPTADRKEASLTHCHSIDNTDRIVAAASLSFEDANTGASPALAAGRTTEPVPTLGSSLEYLCGSNAVRDSAHETAEFIDFLPPEAYDSLLKQVQYSLPETDVTPRRTLWTERALDEDNHGVDYSSAGSRYKPVAKKVRPVSTSLPFAQAQVYGDITPPPRSPLPTHPPPLVDFKPTERLTRDRLAEILERVPQDF